MFNGIVEFTPGQFQSAFQLAAALNFGLSIFRALRQPVQERVFGQAKALVDLAKNSSALAASRLQSMERDARERCIASGQTQNPDLDFIKYLDAHEHLEATEKMVELSLLENEAQELSENLARKTNGWLDTDGLIETLAVVFFFLSLFWLGYSTIYANQKILAEAASVSTLAFSFFALANFLPILLSLLLAFVARLRLSSMRKELRGCERKILRLQLTH